MRSRKTNAPAPPVLISVFIKIRIFHAVDHTVEWQVIFRRFRQHEVVVARLHISVHFRIGNHVRFRFFPSFGENAVGIIVIPHVLDISYFVRTVAQHKQIALFAGIENPIEINDDGNPRICLHLICNFAIFQQIQPVLNHARAGFYPESIVAQTEIDFRRARIEQFIRKIFISRFDDILRFKIDLAFGFRLFGTQMPIPRTAAVSRARRVYVGTDEPFVRPVVRFVS